MRLEIEETAGVKFYRVAEIMDRDLYVSAGTILCLYHCLQHNRRTMAKAFEICEWSRIPEIGQRAEYISALLDAGFIKPFGLDAYSLNGFSPSMRKNG